VIHALDEGETLPDRQVRYARRNDCQQVRNLEPGGGCRRDNLRAPLHERTDLAALAAIAEEGVGRDSVEPSAMVATPVEPVELVVRLEHRLLIQIVGGHAVVGEVEGIAVDRVLVARSTPSNVGLAEPTHLQASSTEAGAATLEREKVVRPGGGVSRSTASSGQRLDLVSAPISDHLEVGHHRHILVFEVVAVEDVLSPVGTEAGDHPHLFAPVQVDAVFPPRVVRRRFAPVPR
jgi:hypothetical protein